MRILIVDDVGFIREMLANVYEAAGHTVVGEAMSGSEAILLAITTKPDIIVMDLVMPDMNGIEATREILSKMPKIKVIVCSALTEGFVINKAFDAGCTAYLPKPFTRVEALEALEICQDQEGKVQYG